MALVLPVFSQKSEILPLDVDWHNKIAIDELFNELRFAANPMDSQSVETKLFVQMLNTEPQTINLALQEAVSLEENGDNDGAFNIYKKLITIQPKYSEVYNRAASVAYRMGDRKDAKIWLQKSLILEPRSFSALTGLGLILEEEEKYKAAEEMFKKALYWNPNYEEAKRGLFRVQSVIYGFDY